jgi:hypothetical protein
MSDQELFTTGQASHVLGITLCRVNQLVGAGALPVALVLPIGKLLLRADVEKLAAKRARRREQRIAAQR